MRNGLPIQVKVCTVADCTFNGRPQPFSNFWRDTKALDGYERQCITCRTRMRKTYARPMIVCACGCGETVNSVDKRGRVCRFVQHHGARQVPVGTRSQWDKYIWIKTETGFIQEHRLMAETAIGKTLPSKCEVHHVNGIKTDNRNANLVICENTAYHALLHARQRIVDAGGDPDTDKICRTCRVAKPLTSYAFDRWQASGRRSLCHACGIEIARYYNRRRSERRALKRSMR